MKVCCGKCCGWHLQVCGMCALAQEGREVERLIGIPTIDYLTYQPVLEYAPSIWNSRQSSSNAPWYSHFLPLSILSKTTLRNFTLTLLAVTLLWPGKRWEHLVLVMGTMAHALILLGLVHWPYHRMDVSVDALVKYFLSGFLLSSTLAITWELVLALLLRAFMSVVFAISGIDVAYDEDGYQGIIGFGSAAMSYHDYLQAFADEHPVFHTIYLLFNTYCVAALVEEVCKYFGYRMVDHVDVWSNEDVQKAVAVGIPEGFVEHEEARQSIPEGFVEHEEGRQSHTEDKQSETVPDLQIEAPKRTVTSIGAAITVSMVAVALGFACCENLVYIFLYNHELDLAGSTLP
jgi:RsiW-degrading membrane proteinase PrsW (M82 family)